MFTETRDKRINRQKVESSLYRSRIARNQYSLEQSNEGRETESLKPTNSSDTLNRVRKSVPRYVNVDFADASSTHFFQRWLD